MASLQSRVGRAKASGSVPLQSAFSAELVDSVGRVGWSRYRERPFGDARSGRLVRRTMKGRESFDAIGATWRGTTAKTEGAPDDPVPPSVFSTRLSGRVTNR